MFSSVLVLLRGCDVHICWDDFYNLGVGEAVACRSAVFRTRVVGSYWIWVCVWYCWRVVCVCVCVCVCVVCCEFILDVG